MVQVEGVDAIAQRKKVVGLVGGLGSGKSRSAAEFARRGAHVVSGDELGHEGLRQPVIKNQVIARWGREILGPDGEVDRRRLAAIVFADPTERQALEGLLFPWIERRFREEIAAAQDRPDVSCIVLDAALLYEADWDRMCDAVVYVHAPRELRRRRLAAQRGWSDEELAAREQAQLPVNEKARLADAVLDNTGAPEDLGRRVEALLREWGCLPLPHHD